jgi:hypothetical protein
MFLTPAFLVSFRGLKEAEEAYTRPPAIPRLDKVDRIRQHIEDIDAQLLKMLGMTKMPLAYVIREQVAVMLYYGTRRDGGMYAPYSLSIQRGQHGYVGHHTGFPS